MTECPYVVESPSQGVVGGKETYALKVPETVRKFNRNSSLRGQYRLNTMTHRLVFKQKLHGEDVINVFNYDSDSVPTQGQVETLATEIITTWSAELLPWLSFSWSLEGVDWFDTTRPPGAPGIPLSIPSLPLVGTGTDASMPNQVACLVNWTCAGGPPFRGRTYFGGWNEDLMDGAGEFSANMTTPLQTLVDDMLRINGGGGVFFDLVIRSTSSDNIPAGTTAVVTNGVVSSTPAIQRKRRKGSGS